MINLVVERSIESLILNVILHMYVTFLSCLQGCVSVFDSNLISIDSFQCNYLCSLSSLAFSIRKQCQNFQFYKRIWVFIFHVHVENKSESYSTTHQRSMEVQFGRYQKNILQEWSMAKLYIPSPLNIPLLQWHTHLNVCAVK